jgi:hypothetical protein
VLGVLGRRGDAISQEVIGQAAVAQRAWIAEKIYLHRRRAPGRDVRRQARPQRILARPQIIDIDVMRASGALLPHRPQPPPDDMGAQVRAQIAHAQPPGGALEWRFATRFIVRHDFNPIGYGPRLADKSAGSSVA